jgi:hypothetical protein
VNTGSDDYFGERLKDGFALRTWHPDPSFTLPEILALGRALYIQEQQGRGTGNTNLHTKGEVTPFMYWFWYDHLGQCLKHLWKNVTRQKWNNPQPAGRETRGSPPLSLPPVIIQVSTLSPALRKELIYVREQMIKQNNVKHQPLLGIIGVPPEACGQKWHADIISSEKPPRKRSRTTTLPAHRACLIACNRGVEATQFLAQPYLDPSLLTPEELLARHVPWADTKRYHGFADLTPSQWLLWNADVIHRGASNPSEILRVAMYGLWAMNPAGQKVLETEIQKVVDEASFLEQLQRICHHRSEPTRRRKKHRG